VCRRGYKVGTGKDRTVYFFAQVEKEREKPTPTGNQIFTINVYDDKFLYVRQRSAFAFAAVSAIATEWSSLL